VFYALCQKFISFVYPTQSTANCAYLASAYSYYLISYFEELSRRFSDVNFFLVNVHDETSPICQRTGPNSTRVFFRMFLSLNFLLTPFLLFPPFISMTYNSISPQLCSCHNTGYTEVESVTRPRIFILTKCSSSSCPEIVCQLQKREIKVNSPKTIKTNQERHV
jgi:hypothetical protein